MLEEAVSRLLDKYNEALKRIDDLMQTNAHQRDELIRTHADLVELQSKYKALQTAHALLSDSPEKDAARKQINALITKVDKTLEILRE